MKRFAYLAISLSAFLVLVSSAQAGVPPLEKTSQYKELVSYVNFLQGLENTPATVEEKNSYTANLTIRVTAANTRLAQLDESRKTAAKNSFIKQKAKILKSAKASAKKQKAQALATYIRYSSQERAIYQGEVNGIQATYDGDIRRLDRQIKRLNKQLDATNNPAKMLRLEKKINKLDDQIFAYRKARIKAKRAAKARYKKAASDERAAYKRRLKRISSRFQQNVKQRNRQAKINYNKQLASMKNTNLSEKEKVLNLNTRGQSYIASMPSVT